VEEWGSKLNVAKGKQRKKYPNLIIANCKNQDDSIIISYMAKKLVEKLEIYHEEAIPDKYIKN